MRFMLLVCFLGFLVHMRRTNLTGSAVEINMQVRRTLRTTRMTPWRDSTCHLMIISLCA
jgi:hypothetical protein